MKNRECSIIRDLLPLYVEEVISEETKQFVDEHLSDCDECKKELALMQTDIFVDESYSEQDSGVETIKQIGLDIKKKRIFTAIIAAVISGILVILSFAYLTAPDYLSYDEAVHDIAVTDNNGNVTLSFTGEYELNQREQGVYDLSVYHTDRNKLFNIEKTQNIIVNPNGETINTIYYVSNDGQEDKVIYGSKPIDNSGVVTLPRLVLSYYFGIAMAFALVMASLAVIFRKNEKLKSIMVKILFIPISYILSHLMIKGWHATSYAASRDFYLILLLAIPIYTLFYILYRKRYSKVSD